MGAHVQFHNLFLFIVLFLFSSLGYASNPDSVQVLFICPSTQGPLLEVGSYIVGYGDVRVDNQSSQKVFFSGLVPLGFSPPVSSYVQNGASYSSVDGEVSCKYIKRNAANFNISYTMINGQGGVVVLPFSNGILLKIPCGLVKPTLS
jgi:hypothetical protein